MRVNCSFNDSDDDDDDDNNNKKAWMLVVNLPGYLNEVDAGDL